MSAMDTFQVAVRVRPMNQKEISQDATNIIDIRSKRQLVFDPVTESNANARRTPKNLVYNYDYVYGQDAQTSQIFDEAVRPLLDKLLEGFNLTIFCYGPTASGKTYTLGDPGGIQERSFQYIFGKCNSSEMQVSYYEVYNEQINDLFTPENKNLDLRDEGTSTRILKLSSHTGLTADQIQKKLIQAQHNRQTSATLENQRSSRSHSIIQVILPQNQQKLLLIDLAGSERLGRTGAEGMRLNEGCNINKSLLALGNCLSALCKGISYVSYRNSKLTRILKDTLQGKSKVLMISCISPASVLYDDTLNTLTYAQRATLIKAQNQVILRPILTSTTEMQQTIQKLQQENQALQKQLEAAIKQGGGNVAKILDDNETQLVQKFVSKAQNIAVSKAKYNLSTLVQLDKGSQSQLLQESQKKEREMSDLIVPKEVQNNINTLKIMLQGQKDGSSQIIDLYSKILKFYVEKSQIGTGNGQIYEILGIPKVQEGATLQLTDLNETKQFSARKLALDKWRRMQPRVPGFGRPATQDYTKELQLLESKLVQLDQTAQLKYSRHSTIGTGSIAGFL